jgi:hypothetical protein
MHFIVTLTPTIDAADALDNQPGGPGPLFDFIADRYHPEAFWVSAGERSVSWIIDAPDATALHELVHIASLKGRTTPQFTPIIFGADAAKVVPAAIQAAAEAP